MLEKNCLTIKQLNIPSYSLMTELCNSVTDFCWYKTKRKGNGNLWKMSNVGKKLFNKKTVKHTILYPSD